LEFIAGFILLLFVKADKHTLFVGLLRVLRSSLRLIFSLSMRFIRTAAISRLAAIHTSAIMIIPEGTDNMGQALLEGQA
jgi:hypothetical protein